MLTSKQVPLGNDPEYNMHQQVVPMTINYSEPKIFTKPPPREQNVPYPGYLEKQEFPIGCVGKYSKNSMSFGTVCYNQDNQDSFVRGNIFANKFPYKLHHKTVEIPMSVVTRTNPVFGKFDPRIKSMLTENKDMYDYKTYPQWSDRDSPINNDRLRLYRYPYNPLSTTSTTSTNTTETFVNEKSSEGLEDINLVVAFVIAVGIVYVIRK